MKRRYLFQAGLASLGALALSRISTGTPKKEVMLSTNIESTDGKAFGSGSYEVMKTEAEWREILTPEQFKVLRQAGTEWAGSSPLDQESRDGVFHCAGCDLPLFSSKAKYNSQTGWPSFYEPIDGATATATDNKFNMQRTEVHCRRCGGHLGHVFLDGPPPTGQRFCINGVALNFVPA